jgi:hypothetical protein
MHKAAKVVRVNLVRRDIGHYSSLGEVGRSATKSRLMDADDIREMYRLFQRALPAAGMRAAGNWQDFGTSR